MGGAQHVITYDGTSIWETVFTPATGWQVHNLSTATGTAVGDHGAPYGFAMGDLEGIAYGSTDGSVHMLVNRGSGWSDLTVGRSANAPGWEWGITAVAMVRTGRFAILYCDGNLHVHELSGTTGAQVADLDLSQRLGEAKPQCGHRSAVDLEADGSEHIFMENTGTSSAE